MTYCKKSQDWDFSFLRIFALLCENYEKWQVWRFFALLSIFRIRSSLSCYWSLTGDFNIHVDHSTDNENGTDQGRLFRATEKLLAPIDDLCFSEYNDNSLLDNDIGRFFFLKTDKIRKGLDATDIEPNELSRYATSRFCGWEQITRLPPAIPRRCLSTRTKVG